MKLTKEYIDNAEFNQSYKTESGLVRIIIGEGILVIVNGRAEFQKQDKEFATSFLASSNAMYELRDMIRCQVEAEEVILSLEEFYNNFKYETESSSEEENLPLLSTLQKPSSEIEDICAQSLYTRSIIQVCRTVEEEENTEK
ncbi:MAG: hypothetical protein ACP5OG_02130 [Candidatus Nanoarchaeia archaeon]